MRRLLSGPPGGAPVLRPEVRARTRVQRSAAAFLLSAGLPLAVLAAAAPAVWDGTQPAPGVYFDAYGPSFYAGFAPRTQDPGRVHLELSRGNQLRLTLVLGPDELDAYLGDLLHKRDLIRELASREIIRLTANRELARFEKALKDGRVEETAAARDQLDPQTYRRRAADIMAKLNPGRVFRIAIPADRIVRNWHRLLRELGKEGLDSSDARLAAANAILPGRTNLYVLGNGLKRELKKAASLALSTKSASDRRFTAQALKFLQLATGGRYPVINGKASAVELTAVYPAATAMAWVPYQELNLPDFGVTGVWPLIRRDQGRGLTGEVDYISSSPGYGYIPLLAYQHIGGVYYNALEGPGVRMTLGETPFLPSSWGDAKSGSGSNDALPHLWIASRGPTSRGSTRLAAGHMSELRSALPSRSADLEKVELFRNQPQCFDLYDVDGDGKERVVGVRYYNAYSIRRNRPGKIYAPNERRAFYAWLYKGNADYRKDGRAFLKTVPACRFTGLRKAAEARTLRDVPLYEAPYARESIQFYWTVPVRFDSPRGTALNRELGRIGAGYEPDRRALFLEGDCCAGADHAGSSR